MEQESPDKLRGMQSHYFILVSIRIISPEEGNLPILHFDDAVIADGNPVGISSKIVKEHLRVSFHLLSQSSHNKASFFRNGFPTRLCRWDCRRTLLCAEPFSKKYFECYFKVSENERVDSWLKD